MSSLVVAARFNGPARSGNGGWTAGALADRVDASAVEVTLRLPPPLETAMTVTTDDGVTTLAAGDQVVAQARPVDPGDFEIVDTVTPDVAAEAMLRYPGLRHHPFPTCFACGTDRAEGDGLRIFPGPVGERPDDRGSVASLWVPHPDHAAAGADEVDVATTWASLDCVGGWSSDLEGRPCVLGRMAARVDALPRVGEPHVVVGRHLGTEGRKTFTLSTLHDADGRVVATARHTWIEVDPALFNEA